MADRVNLVYAQKGPLVAVKPPPGGCARLIATARTTGTTSAAVAIAVAAPPTTLVRLSRLVKSFWQERKMSEAITIAVITGGISLLGNLLAGYRGRKKDSIKRAQPLLGQN